MKPNLTMREEHRYKWQTGFKSFCYFESIEDIIDWWKRFNNYTLEDDVEIDNIDEIRITLQDSPYVIWFQLIRKQPKICSCGNSLLNKEFDITLIVNDYPYAKLFKQDDFGKFLEIFFNQQGEFCKGIL